MTASSRDSHAKANGSTGPRTAAGKARSAQNALRHGLTRATPAPSTLARAEALKAYYLQEDPTMDPWCGQEIALAMVRREDIAHARAEILAQAEAAKTDEAIHPEDARLYERMLVRRLSSLVDLENRAAARLRKLVRRL